MKRKLFKCLSILTVPVLGWFLMYHCTIQNVFDEMYYGHDGVFPHVLHPATYRQFGFIDIHNMTRYMLDDAILEYADKTLVNNGDTLSIIWQTDRKMLEFQYITSLGNDEYNAIFDVDYDTNSNALLIHPIRFSKEGVIIAQNYHALLHDYSLTTNDIEQIFRDNFLELLTNRWFEVNGKRSRFNPEDFGKITIENHLLDSIPE